MYKIAHIARPIAGVGVYIKLLVKHIDDQKFENFLICNTLDKELIIKDKSQKEIPKFQVNLRRELNLLKDVKCLFSIINLLKKNKPDIIHCHSAKAGILGRIAGAYLKIPTIYTPHAFSYLSGENSLKRILFLTVEKGFRFLPSRIIACSNSEYNRAVNELHFKKNKVYIWNNSIEDITELKPSKLLDKLPKEFICSIGRPSYQKNIKMLLEVILQVKNSIKDVHLVLLGIGLESAKIDQLKEFIKNNHLVKNITMIPWLEREEALSILKEGYMYISSARYEGLPYSVIEALSLSKPCVVTKVDGNKDLIIDNYNGYLTELENTKNMTEKILLIFNEKERTEQMSKNSRKEYLNKYNIEKNINELEKIYLSEIAQYFQDIT